MVPFEWTRDGIGPWSLQLMAEVYRRQGFRVKVLGRNDLTAHGINTLSVLVIPGDHVYPEHGPWNGTILHSIARFVRGGGVYVMPVGVSHYVSRDMVTGARDAGHWGPDALGLRFQVISGAGPVRLTREGRRAGIPDPRGIPPPVRSLVLGARTAILAWDGHYQPALVAVRFGKGYVIHTGCGERMDGTFARWWMAASASAARQALEGRLTMSTMDEVIAANGLKGVSLDDLDRRAFRPGPGPLQVPATQIELSPGAGKDHARVPEILKASSVSLDGVWEMAGGHPGSPDPQERLADKPWPDAIPARVPGSVHTALFVAGKIPDPSVGLNADIAREQSFKEWWFRRRFDLGDIPAHTELRFDGVDYSCTVWLNGHLLGRHEGGFGGPVFDVSGMLKPSNTLVVRLDPVPPDWRTVLKTNVVYGWHYVNLPSLGIWRSVWLDAVPRVRLRNVFVSYGARRPGFVDVCLELQAAHGLIEGTLEGTVAPENFTGRPYHFLKHLHEGAGTRPLHLTFRIPHARLWWPNDLGRPNLYRLDLLFTPQDGGAPSASSTPFGLRIIRMAPLGGKPSPGLYNWIFVINGRRVFLKGANWCILDALLRLDRSRYTRFLTLAKQQHIQLLRAWGGGLLETDDFYDLCDRLGILVYQEFPLTWQDFSKLDPAVLRETAVRNVLRLRSHPSLAMWGGGNEHSGSGEPVETIGRICLELDGTRPYHRTDPYGGSLHNYDVYWGRQPLDRNLHLTAPFIGEFGLASPPILESVRRYLPREERNVWPPPETGSFVRHTPTYNKQHIEIMDQYAAEFINPSTLPALITGMQLAQATGLRHTLELARTRWPECTGVCYYKLTDVYPGCSWATVDWYGAPKAAYWVVQQSYAPIHACVLFDTLAVPKGARLRAPVWLLDDAGALKGVWSVHASAYDAQLAKVADFHFAGKGKAPRAKRLGILDVPASAASSVPLLIKVEVRREDALVDRTYYWLNFAQRQGSLFALPPTRLEAAARADGLEITNRGPVPAVGVTVQRPGHADTFACAASYLWVEPGETIRIEASPLNGVTVAAWNAPTVDQGDHP
ncbi:MAG: glycoside hydrolase family 2 protein [Chthonomonadales bacterium]